MSTPREVVFEGYAVAVLRAGDAWFIRYDAGAHQVAMREDAISREEAERAMTGPQDAMEVLFALQRRLIAAGIDPYLANVPG